MSQANRNMAFNTPYYQESFMEDNPFKHSQNYIKEERQYTMAQSKRMGESSNPLSDYSTQQPLSSYRRSIQDFESARKMQGALPSQRNFRQPNPVRVSVPVYDGEDARALDSTQLIGNQDSSYYRANGRASYVGPPMPPPQGYGNRSYVTNSRPSFVEDYRARDVSRETKSGSNNARAKELAIEKLKLENEKLIKELHKYKKMEAGWAFGSSNKKLLEIGELKMQNSSMTEEIVRLKAIISELEGRAQASGPKGVEEENARLRNALSQLEGDKTQLITEINQVRNASRLARENQSLHSAFSSEAPAIREQLEAERRRADGLHSELGRLVSENKSLRLKVESGRESESKMISVENHVSKLTSKISALESENRNLYEQLSAVKAQKSIEAQEQAARFEAERKVVEKLRSELSSAELQAKNEAEQSRFLAEANEGLRSKVVQLEVQLEFQQKKTCPFHSHDEMQKSSEDRVFNMFKEKLEQKTAEIQELYSKMDEFKNQNQELRNNLNTLEVQFETSSNTQGRKERDLISMYKINLDELRMQVDFMNKENAKLKELLKKTESRVNRVDIVRNVGNATDLLAADPLVERLVIKALLADFEYFRLKNGGVQRGAVHKNEEDQVGNLKKQSAHEAVFIGDSLLNSKAQDKTTSNPLLISQESQKQSPNKNGFESFTYKMRFDNALNKY